MRSLCRGLLFAILICVVICTPRFYNAAHAADEAQPKYTFVETDDQLLADYLELVSAHVAALPDVGSDQLTQILDVMAHYALDLPTALSEDELSKLLERHAGDTRLPQLEYFVRACREWDYSASFGIDPYSFIQDPSANAWQPLMDAYATGTADADTLYILQPYYFGHLADELNAQIDALPKELTRESRTAAIGMLCVETDEQERVYLDKMVDLGMNNGLNHYAMARYLWSLGEIDEAITYIGWGVCQLDSYWPEPYPLSIIDDCLERGLIPVPPGGLPATPEEQEQALATVGTICELTAQLGVPIRYMFKLKETAKEGELMLAMNGDPYPLDWLTLMYRSMGEARRGDFTTLLTTSVSCIICTNAMLMYAENFDYYEREALLTANSASRQLGSKVQNVSQVVWSWYPASWPANWHAIGSDETINTMLQYDPVNIDSIEPRITRFENRYGMNPSTRLALVAKGRLTELAIAQVLRKHLDSCIIETL